MTPPVTRFIPSTSAGSERSTTKSSPCFLNASTGGVAPASSRERTIRRTSLPVTSGFCSDPLSANSRSMIFWVSTNHVWSWPVFMMCSSVPSVSNPGNSGTGRRLPVASSHSDDGPGMTRIPWFVQIGFQFLIPSV